jgi:hypothetical protein
MCFKNIAEIVGNFESEVAAITATALTKILTALKIR